MTVTFRRIACTTRRVVSPDIEYIGEPSYNQCLELMGYRLFWRHLLQLCQHWLGRCIVSAHCRLSESRSQPSVSARARSPLKRGRHEFPMIERDLERRVGVQFPYDGGAETRCTYAFAVAPVGVKLCFSIYTPQQLPNTRARRGC